MEISVNAPNDEEIIRELKRRIGEIYVKSVTELIRKGEYSKEETEQIVSMACAKIKNRADT